MNSKQVVQLDEEGYFVGFSTADMSPLEEGVWLIPFGAIDVEAPVVPEDKKAKWENNEWVFVYIIKEQPTVEEVTEEVLPEVVLDPVDVPVIPTEEPNA